MEKPKIVVVVPQIDRIGYAPNTDDDRIDPSVCLVAGDLREVNDWLGQMPTEELLKTKGERTASKMRAFKVMTETPNEFGVYTYRRIRVRVEVSVVDFSVHSNTESCKCDIPMPSGYVLADNPDAEYCNHCKNVFYRVP